MRHIDFDPENRPEELSDETRLKWESWSPRAKAARDRLIAAYFRKEKLVFDKALWQEWRDWVRKHVFDDRCAYCETRFDTARHQPHAEHHRPKGQVTHQRPRGKPAALAQARDHARKDGPHPGYFWLVYDWRNLVPSCARCNTEGGKLSQFPVSTRYSLVESFREMAQVIPEAELLAGAAYADKKSDRVLLGAQQLAKVETPLLLNPLEDRPEEHLAFDDFGGIYARNLNGDASEMGRISIEVYRLDEKDGINRGRFDAQRTALVTWMLSFAHYQKKRDLSPQEAWDRAWREFRAEEGSRVGYPTAVESYIVQLVPRPLNGGPPHEAGE